MDKAVTYIQNRRSYLSTYLEDGRCSFSNNLSENAIRPFTVGRKNWLFCDTPNGAQASAIVYTMVEMAKANGVNVYHYLTYLLEKLPDDRMSDDELELLAPWNETIKAEIERRANESNQSYVKVLRLSIPIKMSTFFGNSEHPFPEKQSILLRNRVQLIFLIFRWNCYSMSGK